MRPEKLECWIKKWLSKSVLCTGLTFWYDADSADPAIIINSPSNAPRLEVKYGLIQGQAYWWHRGWGWKGWGDKSREWGGNVPGSRSQYPPRKLSLLKTRPPPTPLVSMTFYSDPSWFNFFHLSWLKFCCHTSIVDSIYVDVCWYMNGFNKPI